MIYVFCFGASALFAYFANKTQKRVALVFLSLVSILMTVALAGLRDYSIGIDTSNYLTFSQFWAGAVKRDTLQAYMAYYGRLGYSEVLFALLLGIVEHYTGSFTVFLFTVHAVIITGVYIGAFRMKKHANPALVLMLFYLLYFNLSLNITRQYVAMAIVFAALADVEQKKYLRFLIVVIIAGLFHTSALLALGYLVIHWVLYGRFSGIAQSLRPSSRARQLFVIATLATLVLLIPLLCRILIQAGILPAKYSFYLNVEEARYSQLSTEFLLVELAVLFALRKQMRKTTPYYSYFLVSSVAYLILLQLSATIVYGKRIASFFSLGNLITLALIPKSFKVKSNKIVATVLVLAAAFLYWFYLYVLKNSSETYPYIFVFAN